MAKGTQKQATSAAQQLSGASTAQKEAGIFGGSAGAFGPSGLTGGFQGAQRQAGQSRGAAMGGIQEAQATGGFDPTMMPILRSNTANLALTGGFDPTTLSTLQTTGGYDPEAIKFYKNVMSTGGYTPEEEGRFVRQSTSGLTNTYQALAEDAARRRAATGGLGGDVNAQMARHLGQDQSTATTAALSSLHEQEMANKFAGAGGLGGVAAGIRDITGQVAAGRRAGVSQQIGLEGARAGGVLDANQLMTRMVDSDTGQVNDFGKMILGLMGVDTSNQAIAQQTLAQMAKQPGVFDNIMSVIGAVSGSIAPIKIPGLP